MRIRIHPAFALYLLSMAAFSSWQMTLCAVCALMQMALGETDGQGGLRMLGGLLMLHLVLSGAQELAAQLAAEKDLMHIFTILVK